MSVASWRIFSLLAAFGLSSVCVMGCGDGDDGGDVGETKSVKVSETEEISCTPIKGTTDFSLTDKGEIVDYLIEHCRLSTYFRDNAAFLASGQKIGDPCFCYGNQCAMAGYERPEQQTMFGCDNVGDMSAYGMVPICLRSSRVAHIRPELYFPNGTCMLATSRCHTVNDPDGTGYICSFAEFGQYDDVKVEAAATAGCPDGEVLAKFNFDIEIAINEANPTTSTLDVYACLKGCRTNADCRNDFDFIVQEPGQTECVRTNLERDAQGNEIPGDVAGICFDRRVVANSSIGVVAVNAGDYAIR